MFEHYRDVIKQIRVDENLTQEEAAARVGVSRSTWSAWETGRRRPALRHKLHEQFENYERYYMQFVRKRYGNL